MQHNQCSITYITLHAVCYILYVSNYLTLALMCIIQIEFGKRSFFPWISWVSTIFGFNQHHFVKELSSKKRKTFNDMIQRSSNNSIWYSPREMGRYSRVSTGPKGSNNIGWTFMELLNCLFNSGSFFNFKQILTWFGTHIDVFSNHLWKKFLQARPRHYPLKPFSFRLCNPATKQIRLSNHFHVRV